MRSGLLLAVVLGATSGVFADTINVPGDFLTIQEAIDAAVDGDEVEVHPGTYFETINFLGKAIRVYSTDGPDVTIIDAQQTGTVVTCVGVGPETVLEGFTITGGNTIGVGGGMRMSGIPTVTNCTFSGNTANGDGGGMFNDGSPTVTNCTFSGNTSNGRGGGMYNGHDDKSFPTVTNCTFTGNTADIGGGMYNYDVNSTVTNCTFSGNVASFGGGMYNTTWFGGISTVTNCILWGDSPDEFSGDGTPAVSYSNVQGGWPGNGNIDADPLFVDPDNGDYRLSTGSPAIDAGNNWGVPIDENDYDEDSVLCELFPVDLDGNPRFNADEADFDPGCGVPVVVDMGAYEYQFDPADQITFADLNGDGAVGVKDLLGLLGSWGLCGKGCCLADLDINGSVGVTDLLALLGNWGPCP